MTKTAKISAIFFINTLFLVLMRIIFGFVNLSDNVANWLFSFLVQIIGMGVIPMVLFKFWVKEDILTGFSIKIKIPPLTYVLAVVLGFLVSYLTTGVSVIWQMILRLLGYTHINSVGTIYSSAGVLVMELITTALLPGIFEEITDRGLVLRLYRGVENEKMVIIMTGILFGLAHQNIVQTGYAFVGGMIFGFLALRTKSIIPGMIIHFMNNALSVISGYSEQTGGLYSQIEGIVYNFINNYFFIAIITWVATAALIIVILKFIAKIQPKEEKKEDDVFFFPNKVQYVDDLFGTGLKKDISLKEKTHWSEYAFLYGAIALTALTTIFTFLWGLWR